MQEGKDHSEGEALDFHWKYSVAAVFSTFKGLHRQEGNCATERRETLQEREKGEKDIWEEVVLLC